MQNFNKQIELGENVKTEFKSTFNQEVTESVCAFANKRGGTVFVRELILNMIVHRDYRFPSESCVKVFADHIEFFNPGKLLDDMSVEDLLNNRYLSTLRNKAVANHFHMLGEIEKDDKMGDYSNPESSVYDVVSSNPGCKIEYRGSKKTGGYHACV